VRVAQLHRFWRSPLLLPVAAFLTSLAAALRAGMVGTEGHLIYAVDDAYIHMAVAKNLANTALWGCTPFHFSSSSSSLLWTFLLGAAYRAFGVHDLTPLILNIAFAVSTLVVTDRFLRRFGAPPVLSAAAMLGLVVAFPLAGMALMGMEHTLHLLLTIWFGAAAVDALTSSSDDRQVRRRQTIGLCLLGALLGASRYEGFFLVGLACVGFVARRQVLQSVSIAAAALLPVAAFGAISVASGAFFLPNSLMLKAAGESVSALSTLLKPPGREDLAFLRNNLGLLVLLVGGLSSALGLWRSRRHLWHPQVLLPLLLALMILLHGHYVFSPTFWVYRYDAYLVGFGIFAAAVVLAPLRGPGVLAQGGLSALVVVCLVGIVADVREGFVPTAEIAGMKNTYLEHYQAAQFIRRYYPGDVVIVNDLGAVTYYTQGRILDLVGLGDIEPLEIMRRTGGYTSVDVRAWTSRYQPAIAIIQLGWSWVVPRVPGEWIKVAEVEVPTNRQRVGFFAVDPKEAWILRASVEQHYAPLGQALGYRVKLRSPERMNALATGADADRR
jgi:hypothetical protein